MRMRRLRSPILSNVIFRVGQEKIGAVAAFALLLETCQSTTMKIEIPTLDTHTSTHISRALIHQENGSGQVGDWEMQARSNRGSRFHPPA